MFDNRIYAFQELDGNSCITTVEIKYEKAASEKRWVYDQKSLRDKLFIKDFVVISVKNDKVFICTSIDKKGKSKLVELKEEI